VLVLAAFPPLNLALLVFVGLVPLLLALMKSSPRRAIALGYVFGLVYMLAQMFWLQALVVRWTNDVALSFLPWILAGLIGAWYFALFGWLANRCFRAGMPWMVPLVWAGIEVFRSYIPGLAFPWALLSDPLWRATALIQTAYFGSIYVVSAWCALASLIVAFWIEREKWKVVRPYATAFLLTTALSFARYGTPLPDKKMKVTVGQPGVDMAFGDADKREEDLGVAVHHLMQVAIRTNSSLLVLPEGLADASDGLPPNAPFAITDQVPVLFGGKRGKNPPYQSAFSYDGEKWQYADKTRLVVFGEYVPGRNWIPFLSAFHLPSGDLVAGEKLGVVDIRGTKVGPLICFEGLFPDLAYRQALNGAQMLAILSIDDWYMGTSAPEQLKSEAVWRAVETGLPLVRSASLGYSLAVDGHGRVLSEAPIGKTIALYAEVPLPDRASPFPLYPIFPAVSLLSLAGAVFAPKLKRREAVGAAAKSKKGRK
jgi:apolipoprotein N-acyltransferase